MDERGNLIELLELRLAGRRLAMTELLVDDRFDNLEGELLVLVVFHSESSRFDVSKEIEPRDARFARYALALMSILRARSFAMTRSRRGIEIYFTFNASGLGRQLSFTNENLGSLYTSEEGKPREWLREQVACSILQALLEDVIGLRW